jgi:FixJ family two-component response regulator
MSMPLAVVDIVDDNVEVLRSVGRVLSAHGYPVCMFTSAELYLRTVEEGKACCVVVSLGLRGSISGLDVGRAVRASGRAMPVIFIAGSADASMKAEALLMGCLAYLEEPVSSELLISAVRSSGAASSWHPPPGPGR